MAWHEKLPSGRYRGCYRDAAGIKHTVKGTFAHKAAAERAAAAEEAVARTRVGGVAGRKRTWGDWKNDWLSARDVEPSTARTDLGRIKNHIEPRWADVPLGAITRQDVKTWVKAMRRDGKSNELIKRIVHLFSASLNAAIDAEILESNPAARISLSAGAQAQETYLSFEEYEALLEQFPTPRDQLVVKMLANTGLRWGELAGLHWNRVDLSRGTLRVVEVWDEAGNQVKAYPKGKRVRTVPLPDDLVAELRKLPVKIGGCGHPHAQGTCRSGLVLTTKFGNVLRHTKWSRVWREAVTNAGIEHVRIHDLRHTYASWLLQSGEVSLAEVGELLGHVSTQTTQKYAHLEKAVKRHVLTALPRPNPAVTAPDLHHEANSESSQGRSDAQGIPKAQRSHTPTRPLESP